MADQIDYCDDGNLSNGILPADVTVIILLKLPVKSLVKFTVVCKSWLSFIGSPRFMKIHLHRQFIIPNDLILSRDCVNNEIALVTRNCCSTYSYAAADVLLPKSKSVILDSCNGLVCLSGLEYGDSGSIILWNLATGKHRFIDLPLDTRPFFIFAGLAYIAATNDFKIVGSTFTFTDNNILSVPKLDEFIYTLSSNSWRKLVNDSTTAILQPARPIFLKGCMHYLMLMNRHRLIGAFDAVDEVMSHFALPDNCSQLSEFTAKLVVIRDLLSVLIFHESKVSEKGIEIWVMKEYGVEESWTKQFIIEGLTTVVRPLGSWKDGDLLFAYKELDHEILMSYDPFTKNKKYYPEIKSTCFEIFNFVESLASVEGEI